MNLLETEGAIRWLELFEVPDKPSAQRLAESIHLIKRQEVESGLNAAIVQAAKANVAGSVAMFVVRELESEDEEPHASESEDFEYSLYIEADDEDQPQSYFPESRSERPSAFRPGFSVGSEGPMANLIRDISQRAGASQFLDHPSLDQMAATKTKTVILVDDLIASGTRIRRFLKGFFKHKTIKSWFSGDLFRLMIVTYAATTKEKQSIERDPRVHKVVTQRLLEHGSSTWKKTHRDRIEYICHKYARLTSRPKWPLGYGSAFTCICFDYGVPNTLPAILWAGSRRWFPLFQKRPALDHPVWPTQLDAIAREKRVLEAVGQTQLSSADFDKYVSTEGRQSLLLLALVAMRLRTPDRLAPAIGVSDASCATLILRSQARGWITSNVRLTEAGKRELRHARELHLIEGESDITLSKEYYVPQSLRASRD